MKSFRRRTLLYLAALAIPLALGVLVPVMLIQSLLDQSLQMYAQNREYQSAASMVEELETQLRIYLQTRSTDSLRAYLSATARVQGVSEGFAITVSREQVERRMPFLERSAFYLVQSLLQAAETAVQAKRGRSPELYSQSYSEVMQIKGMLENVLIQLSQQELSRVMQMQEAFQQQFTKMQWASAAFLLSLAVLTAVLASLFAGRITEPITRLAASALRLANGDFTDSDIPPGGSTEIRNMADAFNRMKHAIQRNIQSLQRAAEMEKGLKQAELAVLQSQIHPHFLYNALNTGVQLAEIENGDRTSEYLDALARLFRETLRSPSEATTLGREIETLRQFLYIMQIRFGGSIQFADFCPPETRATPMPRMILQPLVENSIVHGFREGKGALQLRAYPEGHRMVVELSDDGIGMSRDVLQTLLLEAEQWVNEPLHHELVLATGGAGIGVRNVMYRVRLFTGRSDSFELKLPTQGGVLVRIKLGMNGTYFAKDGHSG